MQRTDAPSGRLEAYMPVCLSSTTTRYNQYVPGHAARGMACRFLVLVQRYI